MEAPEKLYLSKNIYSIFVYQTPDPDDETQVEYIHKDAFIEKACEWLKENFSFDEAGYCKTNIYSVKSMIDNFKDTLGGNL